MSWWRTSAAGAHMDVSPDANFSQRDRCPQNEHATQRQLPFEPGPHFASPAAVKVGRSSSSDVTFVCERVTKTTLPSSDRLGHAGLTSSRALIPTTVDKLRGIPHRKRNVVSSADLGGSLETAVLFFSGSSYGSQALFADIGPRRISSKWTSLSRLAGDLP